MIKEATAQFSVYFANQHLDYVETIDPNLDKLTINIEILATFRDKSNKVDV